MTPPSITFVYRRAPTSNEQEWEINKDDKAEHEGDGPRVRQEEVVVLLLSLLLSLFLVFIFIHTYIYMLWAQGYIKKIGKGKAR